jgi:hypothetical protein
MINFTLRLTTDQGVFDVLSLQVNLDLATFSNNGNPIPDNSVGGATRSFPSRHVGSHHQRDAVDARHPRGTRLVARLRAPNGAVVWLTAGRGASGDNYGTSCANPNRTVFDQTAATAIGSGVAPFVGTFRPEPGPRTVGTFTVPAGNTLASLNGLTGANLNGNWSLDLFDTVGLDTGSLQCWSLTIATNGSPCAGNGGVGCTLATTCTATPDTGNAPLLVNFDASPAGGGGSFTYSWDFGDGFTGNIKNPSHTYTNAGSYTATVTVKDLLTMGQPTITCSKIITVGQTSRPHHHQRVAELRQRHGRYGRRDQRHQLRAPGHRHARRRSPR